MSRFLLLIAFIVIVQGIGALIGTSFQPGEWYETLNKPFFQPPPEAFGIVWPILYFLIAIAGWKVFIAGGDKPGWGYWVVQMIFNWAYTPVFFGWNMIFWGMMVVLVTLIAAVAFIKVTWNTDRLAALCFIPYAAWLSYALLLSVSIWLLN